MRLFSSRPLFGLVTPNQRDVADGIWRMIYYKDFGGWGLVAWEGGKQHFEVVLFVLVIDPFICSNSCRQGSC